MSEIERITALLIEDDDEDALIFSRHVANMSSYRVKLERVSQLERAEFALSANHFDIVFLDLNLGVSLDGMEFLKRMQSLGMITPFIVVTGSRDRSIAIEAMKSGAYDYVVKDALSPDLIDQTLRGAMQRYALEQERAAMMAKMAEMVATDELTGVANRRRLMEKIEEEQHRSERTLRPFACLMIDLDRFKRVNDQYGHQTGDLVLRQCAAALQKNVRVNDVVARYGGEEFCVVMPETDHEGACSLAERLRAAVASLPDPVPTVSIGMAVWREGDSADRVLSSADKALYEAKNSGRNRVVVCSSE